jgi:dTDP-4-dehydrorhamnose reductase
MRLLVTGASGLLGLNLSLAMHRRHAITGVDRSRLVGVPFELLRADLLDAGAEARILDSVRPEAVVHCAAWADMDACEVDPAGAQRVNAELPGTLARSCAQRGIRLIYISTDGVFDGSKQGAYTEEDMPNPQGAYSRTKLEGERNVLSADPRALVARVNFFGWSLAGNRSLAEFFLGHLMAGEACQGFNDVWFCPLFAGHLANILVEMLEQGLSGLYHVVGSEALTKYEFGLRIARQFGLDESLIRPISVEESGLRARRSHNLRLSVHKLSTDLKQEIPSLSTGLPEFFAQYQQGYPQELRSYQHAGVA